MAMYTSSMRSEVSSMKSVNLDVTDDLQMALMDITKKALTPGTNVHSLSEQIASNFKTMMEKLNLLNEMLPGAIQELTTLRDKVDAAHKRSNGTVATSSAVSFTGGCLIVGGLAATPFTGGASIGLTAAGIGIVCCATITTVVAQGKDFHKQYKSVGECERHKSRIEACYEDAKTAYEAFNNAQANLRAVLIAMIPQLEKNDKDIQDAFVLSLAGIIPKHVANKKMICGYASRAVPVATVTISPFSREGLAVVKLFLPVLKVTGSMLTTAGFVVAGLGLLVDAVLGIYSGYCFFSSSHKCKASQTISTYINELDHLRHKVKLIIACSEQQKELILSEWRIFQETDRLAIQFEDRQRQSKEENLRLSIEVNEAREENQRLQAEAARANEENQRLRELLALQGNVQN